MVKNLSITGAVAVALVFGVLYFKAPSVVTVPQITQLGSTQQSAPVVNVEASKPVVVPAPIVNVNVPKQETVKLGAVTSPYVPGNEFSVADVLDFYYRYQLGTGLSSSTDSIGLGLGTTTPCSILSPNATTSLVRASIAINTSTSTAGTWTLATSTTAYASTTFYATFSVTANKLGYYEYIASSTTSGSERLFKPNTYLNWTVAGAPGRGTIKNGFIYPNSYCQAQFRRL